MAKKWSGQTSGANIPHVHVYLCEQCLSWYDREKPAQCRECGCIAFIHFPSKAEAKRFGELNLERKCGIIFELKTQPRFKLHAIGPDGSKIKIGEYRGDFGYNRDNQYIVEDIKGGADTALSAWKRKHVNAEYNIEVKIVRR